MYTIIISIRHYNGIRVNGININLVQKNKIFSFAIGLLTSFFSKSRYKNYVEILQGDTFGKMHVVLSLWVTLYYVVITGKIRQQ
jgi:hypothetical protein